MIIIIIFINDFIHQIWNAAKLSCHKYSIHQNITLLNIPITLTVTKIARFHHQVLTGCHMYNLCVCGGGIKITFKNLTEKLLFTINNEYKTVLVIDRSTSNPKCDRNNSSPGEIIPD